MPVPELSPIEEQIVLLVAEGQSHDAIAADLGVSVRTVEWHVDRARGKLDRAATLRDRVQAAKQPPEQKEDVR